MIEYIYNSREEALKAVKVIMKTRNIDCNMARAMLCSICSNCEENNRCILEENGELKELRPIIKE